MTRDVDRYQSVVGNRICIKIPVLLLNEIKKMMITVDENKDDMKIMTSSGLQKTYAAICATPVGQIIKNVKNSSMNGKLEKCSRDLKIKYAHFLELK